MCIEACNHKSVYLFWYTENVKIISHEYMCKNGSISYKQNWKNIRCHFPQAKLIIVQKHDIFKNNFSKQLKHYKLYYVSGIRHCSE